MTDKTYGRTDKFTIANTLALARKNQNNILSAAVWRLSVGDSDTTNVCSDSRPLV